MQQSSAAEEPDPSSELPRKTSKQKKDIPKAPDYDALASALVAGMPGFPGTLRSISSPAPPGNEPASVTQEQFCVDANQDRVIGATAELAFALRLKPLVSATGPAPDDTVGNAAGPRVTVAQTKTTEISAGVPGSNPAAVKPGNQSGAGAENGDGDSKRGNHPGTHGTPIAAQPEKTAHPETTETPAFVEGAKPHAQAMESNVMPVADSKASPSLPGGPAPTKTSAPTATALAGTSLEREEGPVTTRPAQEISLQISSHGDQKVDVRLVERAGEVHVIVRTPDVALAHELRQDLGSLTGKLAQSGYGTEQFTPLSAGSSTLSDHRSTPENHDSPGRHDQGPQHGSGQQQQPQDEQGKRPAWVEEMEKSLTQRQTNRSRTWLFNQ